MFSRCDFVAFREDLRLKSPIIKFFRDRRCVQTSEQSRALARVPSGFGEKSGMVWRKIRYLEKNPVLLEKNVVFLEKNSVSIPSSLALSQTSDQAYPCPSS